MPWKLSGCWAQIESLRFERGVKTEGAAEARRPDAKCDASNRFQHREGSTRLQEGHNIARVLV